MKLFCILLICLLLFACSDSTTANNTIASPVADSSPSQTPRTKLEPEIEDTNLDKAVSDFVEKKHKPFKIEGIVIDQTECTEAEFIKQKYNCVPLREHYFEIDPNSNSINASLHLINGKQEKVIAVIFKKFRRVDGHVYWLVYEATALDLATQRIRLIKNREQKHTLANLTYDDCESVIEAARNDDYLGDARD